MKKINTIRFLISILLFLAMNYSLEVSAEEGLMHAAAAIHISSTVSDGKLSIDEIVEIARQNNIKIVILTDRDFMKWEYGLWPLRRIIKKTVERNSVFTYGIKRYLKEIEVAQSKNTDLVVIPGVESAPFYYWKGSPFKNNLKICNWHKHMLVIGLDKVEDYKNLPSLSNGYSLALAFRFKDVYHLWPILILMIGISCLRRRKFRYKNLQGRSLGPYSRPWQIFGTIIIFFSLLFLFNSFPFTEFKYDQYHGDQGVSSYQNLIDYVNGKGGLIFWAHPEAENIQTRGKIKIETEEHTQDLLDAKDYTGFAIFYEGYEKIGHPGGIWDDLLKEYCKGKRDSPIWVIAGLAFDQEGNLGARMQNLRTIFLIPRLAKSEVLKALRNGRMYVVRGPQGFYLLLDEFAVYDSFLDNKDKGIVGDEVNIKGKTLLKIHGAFLDKDEVGQIKVRLIRNGNLVKTFEVISPFEIDYQDDYFDEGKKIYYRLEILYPGGILVTNPIFVKFRH